MVTREQLNQHLGSSPFRPFRVILVNGEALYVVRRAQALASSRMFMIGTPEDRMRRIPLEQVDRVEVLEQPQKA